LMLASCNEPEWVYNRSGREGCGGKGRPARRSTAGIRARL